MSEEEYEVEALAVEVSAQPIELYKVLKIANAVSGGGEAKYAIAEGYVAVNGELEQRKRRKMYDGDVIEFNNEFYVVICDQPVDESPQEPELAMPKTAKKADKPGAKQASGKGRGNKSASGKKTRGNKAGGKKKSESQAGPADQSTGRKPISF
ncbi:RNA-binding S4 domain-containing protein [Photobacterium kasasachensis]|uniref:RNA-binding S4 domain-containing protein n=1 Tax=Photobacterium kasasachensis TaxID=2910240 RepID=UPI003D11837A